MEVTEDHAKQFNTEFAGYMSSIVTKGGGVPALNNTSGSAMYQPANQNNKNMGNKYRKHRFEMNESVEQVQNMVKGSIHQCNIQKDRMGNTFKKESLKENYRGL